MGKRLFIPDMKHLINFIFDVIAFLIAMPILIYWRAQRTAAKIESYIRR